MAEHHPSSEQSKEHALRATLARALTDTGSTEQIDLNEFAAMAEHGMASVPEERREAVLAALIRQPELLSGVLDVRDYLYEQSEGGRAQAYTSRTGPGFLFRAASPMFAAAASLCLVSGVGFVLETQRQTPPASNPYPGGLQTESTPLPAHMEQESQSMATALVAVSIVSFFIMVLSVGLMIRRRRLRRHAG